MAEPAYGGTAAGDDSTRPLPDVTDPLTAPFWAALRQRRLQFQACTSCAYLRWPAARRCPECLSLEFEWKPVSGQGTVWSYAVYEQAFHPAFADDVPYLVGAIEIAEGPFVFATIVDPPDDLRIGHRVSVVFDDVTPEVTLARFRVVDSEAGRS
jgi:uncharacterized OB-fold protein